LGKLPTPDSGASDFKTKKDRMPKWACGVKESHLRKRGVVNFRDAKEKKRVASNGRDSQPKSAITTKPGKERGGPLIRYWQRVAIQQDTNKLQQWASPRKNKGNSVRREKELA